MNDQAKQPEPVAWRMRNTSFRQPHFEFYATEKQAKDRQAAFNMSVDDGGLYDLTPLYASPPPAQPPQAEPVETVPWPTVTCYSGGVSHEGIGGRVWIQLDDNGAEVEYVPAQPKREPLPMLTDEQINAAMESCLNDWDWRDFARAIERLITERMSAGGTK